MYKSLILFVIFLSDPISAQQFFFSEDINTVGKLNISKSLPGGITNILVNSYPATVFIDSILFGSSDKWTAEYTDNKTSAFYRYSIWNGISETLGRITIQYDEKGRVITEIDEDFVENNWEPVFKITKTYDAEGNELTYSLSQFINGDSIPLKRSTKEYNEFNKVNYMLNEDFRDNEWVRESRASYYYTGLICDSILYQIDNGLNTEWLNSYIYYLYYDGPFVDKPSSVVAKEWYGDWMNNALQIYEYDLFGNTINGVLKKWDIKQWTNYFRYGYSYNADGLTNEGYGQEFSDGGWKNAPWFLTINWLMEQYNLAFYTENLVVYYTMKSAADDLNENFSYTLHQNYPNPFNPETIIKFSLKEKVEVNLSIFDQLGREVAVLVNEEKPAGTFEINFNASNLASGVYIYRLKAGEYITNKKMLLMK